MLEYYAIVQNMESEEFHIQKFEKKIDRETKSIRFIPVTDYSECGEFMDKKYSSPIKQLWKDGKKYPYFKEDAMRYVCADIGRQVCGRCVSTLYASQDDDGNWLF